jgi:hypothetical protein
MLNERRRPEIQGGVRSEQGKLFLQRLCDDKTTKGALWPNSSQQTLYSQSNPDNCSSNLQKFRERQEILHDLQGKYIIDFNCKEEEARRRMLMDLFAWFIIIAIVVVIASIAKALSGSTWDYSSSDLPSHLRHGREVAQRPYRPNNRNDLTRMNDPRNPFGWTNPVSPNNPNGWTNMNSLNNPFGWRHPASPNNPHNRMHKPMHTPMHRPMHKR